MYLSYYNIIYFISNIFGTYTIFKFMTVFFQRDKSNKNTEFLTYFLYYLIIGIIYIFFNIPLLNLFSNLVLFFLITFNYKSTWKARFNAVVYIYSILICTETATIMIMKFLKVDMLAQNLDMELIFSLIFSKILSYIVVLAISNFKMLKAKNNISSLHWAAIFFIPFGSLFSTLVLIVRSNLDNIFVLFSIVILFTINIFVFYLYDVLMQYYKEKIDKELLQQQNDAYTQQMNIIKQSQENLSILRHDFKFHITSLQALIEKHDIEKALNYLRSSFDALNTKGEYAKSGNQEVDSILNYKINEALNRDIEIELSLSIPDRLRIAPFDLVAILGNLFDNAIEATSKVGSNRKITIDIRYDKNLLFISFTNPFSEIIIENQKLYTTRQNKENHGFGIESVKKAVEKYNGTLEIRHLNNIFYIDALLYNPIN